LLRALAVEPPKSGKGTPKVSASKTAKTNPVIFFMGE
jgi:hypothetical protein